MGTHVNRKFVVFIVRTYYLARKNHYFSCFCYKCQRLQNILNEINKHNFYTSNLRHQKWFIIFHKKHDSKVTLFQFLFEKNVKTNCS